MQTRFRSFRRSVFLVVFLLLVPGVFTNNYFWHPESLLMLFLSGVLLFLSLDQLKFGRFFFLAAICCGLATGTKHMGVLFFLTIPIYLIWGIIGKRIPLSKGIWYAILFVLLMAGAIIISNPLLLLPQERAEIITVQKQLFFENTGGFFLRNLDPFFKNGEYPEDFRIHFGEWWFALLGLICLLAGFFQKEKRLNSTLVLTWIIPVFIYFGFIAVTRRTHYFILSMLPLFSCLDNFFSWSGGNQVLPAKPKIRLALTSLVVVLIVAQSILFIRTDIDRYLSTLNREKSSPSIQFFRQVEEKIPVPVRGGNKTKIYRDWHVYVADNSLWQTETSWDLPDYAFIDQLSPDVIFLEMENVQLYANPASIEKAIDAEKIKKVHLFYKDASSGNINGYSLIYQDHFGLAFIRDKKEK